MTSSFTRDRLWQVLATTPRLLRLVWRAVPRWLLVNLGVTLVRSLLPVAELYITKLIVDGVVGAIGNPEIDWTPLAVLVGLRFGLSLLFEGLSQVNAYVLQVLKDRFSLYANRALLHQAIRLDLAHYELPEFYDTLSRAQQSGSDYPVRILGTLTELLGQVVNLAGVLTLLVSFSPVVMLLLLLASVPAFWVGIRFSGKRFWMLRGQTQSGRMADYLQQVLTQQAFVKEVRLFRLGSHLLDRWQEIRDRFNQESAALASKHAQVRGGIGAIANLGFYAAYGWTIVQAVRGTITVGDFTMYTGAFGQAQSLTQRLLYCIAQVYEYNLYVSQYFEFLSLTPKIQNTTTVRAFPNPIAKGLEFRGVSFTYPGASQPTLQDISFQVKPGESIALVGANGAGKTTLLKLLTRLYDPNEGSITVDRIPLQAFDLAELRRNIGVLFQDFSRYNLSVRDNIGFGNLPELDNQPLLENATANAGAADIVTRLEQGYQTILGKMFAGGADLSGGQWQKIALARAFMSPAPILILDEPSAALDAIAEAELFQRFHQLAKGKMTFFVSHRFSTVRVADRIVVLDKSQVAEIGTHAELLAQEGLYARMFRLQARSYQDDRTNGDRKGDRKNIET